MVEGILGLETDADEVVDGLAVREVLVQVVLEMLQDVHLLLDELVSADAREPERLVVELPGMNLHLGVEALLLELAIDHHGGVVVRLVEAAREVVELDVKLLLGDVDGRLASRGATRAQSSIDHSLERGRRYGLHHVALGLGKHLDATGRVELNRTSGGYKSTKELHY